MSIAMQREDGSWTLTKGDDADDLKVLAQCAGLPLKDIRSARQELQRMGWITMVGPLTILHPPDEAEQVRWEFFAAYGLTYALSAAPSCPPSQTPRRFRFGSG
jgi:hypothetical protein